MAEGDEDSDDKQHEPTQKKLDDARKRGEVPMSQDLTTSGAYAGLVIAALTFGAVSLSDMGSALAKMLEQADPISKALFDGPATSLTGELILAASLPMLPWLVVPLIGVVLSVIAQQAFTVSGKKIAPKLSRISPLSNAKQKFGREGLFNFAKSLAKLIIFSGVLALVIGADLPEILASVYGTESGLVTMLLGLSLDFLMIVLVISFAIGALDFLWQRAQHIRKNRMSHKDLQDEAKDSEGDPHLKQRRRQKGMDIATNRMIADVPKADVVIVNPTHFAVALQWDRDTGRAPICLAKGTDEVAARIREVAQENAIPIRRDPPTARALHATLSIGDEVLPEHYRPVAAAIRFAEEVRKRAPGGRRR
ncbi:MAG: flagellar type III secretion system protein FlhB [Pseudomonadota bacterium]